MNRAVPSAWSAWFPWTLPAPWWRGVLFLRGEGTQAKQFSAVLLGQVPQSFGCRRELHGQKVVKIPFGLGWNQDSLGSLEWLCLLFSVNLHYCPALLVLLTCLGLTCAIVAAIALSYRQLPACWHWGFHGVLVNQSVSSWLLACCCALDWCCKCSNALPNKTAACMGSWKLKFVCCLRASDSAAIAIKRLVGVENPQIWNRLTAAPGQNQYTLYLGHQCGKRSLFAPSPWFECLVPAFIQTILFVFPFLLRSTVHSLDHPFSGWQVWIHLRLTWIPRPTFYLMPWAKLALWVETEAESERGRRYLIFFHIFLIL